MITPDPGEHLPLIHRVIHQMGLRGDTAEEAFSEGLVAITEAAQSFDPGRNVPIANWLAMNIRWSLKTWIIKQHSTNIANLEGTMTEPILDVEVEAHPTQDSTLEFKELISKMEKLLSYEERQILLADAMGYSGKWIAEVLGISQVQVSKKKKKAQEKLKKEEIFK